MTLAAARNSFSDCVVESLPTLMPPVDLRSVHVPEKGTKNWANCIRLRPGCQGEHLTEKAMEFKHVTKHYYKLA
jgi:hypothetical protein